jgi:2-haloalkanoic acid dehalogenase type II
LINFWQIAILVVADGKQVDRVKAIFFDLDETLYDHRHACTSGIRELQHRYPALRKSSAEELESEFWRMLDMMYQDVLWGKVTEHEARRARIRALFELCGAEVADDTLDEAVAVYRQAYVEGRRAIPGAIEVVTWLREKGYILAVVTNGMTHVQQDKMAVCGLTHLVDHLITAQEVGCVKPERAMFQVALDRCGVQPHEALMIGDSWGSDMIGAQAAGLPAIWFNRRDEVCQDPAVATEIVELNQLFALWSELSRLQSKGVTQG